MRFFPSTISGLVPRYAWEIFLCTCGRDQHMHSLLTPQSYCTCTTSLISDKFFIFAKNNLAPEFWCKHNMIFAIPNAYTLNFDHPLSLSFTTTEFRTIFCSKGELFWVAIDPVLLPPPLNGEFSSIEEKDLQ